MVCQNYEWNMFKLTGMDGCMNEWVGGWLDEWVDGPMQHMSTEKPTGATGATDASSLRIFK